MLDFDVFSSWSYVGIIVFLILTGCGFPLPEEVAFVYAGYASAAPARLHWALALGACGIGALLGDSVMYAVGRLGRGWISQHAWFSRIVHLEREEQVRRLIARHGIKVFFAARFMVGIRGPLYVTLGILKVPFWRFLIVDTICASLVINLFFWLAYYFGDRFTVWIQQGERVLTVVVIAALAIGGIWWFLHNRRKNREVLEEAPSPPPTEAEPIAAVTESLLGVAHEELVGEPHENPPEGEAPGDGNNNGQHRPPQETLSPTSRPD